MGVHWDCKAELAVQVAEGMICLDVNGRGVALAPELAISLARQILTHAGELRGSEFLIAEAMTINVDGPPSREPSGN